MSHSQNFKQISLVPDYRALQIISENIRELDGFLSDKNCDAMLKEIVKDDDNYRKFRKTAVGVEEYLSKKQSGHTVNSENAAQLSNVLKEQFGMSPEEIVMVLNQMPNNEALLDLMFPARFSKEQLAILCQYVTHILQIKT